MLFRSHRRMEGLHAACLGELGIVDGKPRKTPDNTSAFIRHAASVVDLGSNVIRLDDFRVGEKDGLGSPVGKDRGGPSVSLETALSACEKRPLDVSVGGLVGPQECLGGIWRDVPACPRHEGEACHEVVVSSGFGCGVAKLVPDAQDRAHRCDL